MNPLTTPGKPEPVTPENFARAETENYMARLAGQGALGRFVHRREPLRIDKQIVVRGNPDAFVSHALFDLDAGPVTVTMPDAGNRLMSLQVINQDHYTTSQVYAPAVERITREGAGTRYVLVLVRTLVDPSNPADVARVHALQDALHVQQASTGVLALTDWDMESLRSVRAALLALARHLPETSRMFGTRDQVDPVRHLIGAAYAWGGQPEQHAYYLNVTPAHNDGRTIHRMRIVDVPVDGYWSVTVYNREGYMERNPQEVYTINSVIARHEPDGAVELQFGGCDGRAANCIPIMEGWNYLVRLYRARPEVLDGTWQFPSAEPLEPNVAQRAGRTS